MHTLDQILSLITQYGYLIVLFGVMAESAGLPVPGETVLVAAGVLAQQGRLGIGDAILFGILGAVTGDQIGYWVGRKGGRPFVLKWGSYVKITPERLGHAEGFFARHGGKTVFIARFVAGLRVFGALAAGVSRMHWRTFFFYNALGSVVWSTAAVTAGYLLGGSIGLVERWAGRASALLAVLILLATVLYLAYRWVRDHPETVREAANRLGERLGGARVLALSKTRAGLWVRRRLAPHEVYGLTLTLGLLIFALSSWAFAGITEDILTRDPLVRVDLDLLRFFHSHGEPHLTAMVSIFETIFSPEVLLVGAAVAGTLLMLRGRGRRDFGITFSGTILLVTAFGTGGLIELFKTLFDRPRPPSYLQLVAEMGNGFPSGHTMASLAIGATIWYLFALRPPGSRWGSWRSKARAGAAVIAIALLVGLGRAYTGAHYPSDVLAGWALGTAWTSVCLTSAEVFRRLRRGGKAPAKPLAHRPPSATTGSFSSPY